MCDGLFHRNYLVDNEEEIYEMYAAGNGTVKIHYHHSFSVMITKDDHSK